MGTADRTSNKTQDLKGRVKEVAGRTVGNDDLERKGKSDQAKATVKDAGESVKEAAGDVRDAAKDAIDRVKS